MARISAKKQAAALLEIPQGSDLPIRIMNISEQVSLSPSDLIHKWVLQEEAMIGLMQLMQPGKKQVEKQPKVRQAKTRRADAAEETERAAADSPKRNKQNYRNMLVKKAKQLKKEGMTLNKIADTFNAENISTISGAGKWYSSSVANLMNPKK